jgi:hypothetical protein
MIQTTIEKSVDTSIHNSIHDIFPWSTLMYEVIGGTVIAVVFLGLGWVIGHIGLSGIKSDLSALKAKVSAPTPTPTSTPPVAAPAVAAT